MLNKDSVGAGLAAGSVLPALSWIVFDYLLHNDAIIMDKPAVPYLIAIGLNLVLIRYFFANDRQETINGIMIATF
jgi:hypothetical protein